MSRILQIFMHKPIRRKSDTFITEMVEDGEYGKWLSLCKSRRELWELKRSNRQR